MVQSKTRVQTGLKKKIALITQTSETITDVLTY